VLQRSGIDGADVEDLIAGCCWQFGPQGLNIARTAWLQEGLPLTTPATTLDRQCGSAQQAVNFGASSIAAGVNDMVIGSGVEHMGKLPFSASSEIEARYGAAHTDRLLQRYEISGQGLAAELISDRWGFSRDELDEIALRSHRLAARATEESLFSREMVTLDVASTTVSRDQGIRPETSMEALGSLRPAFKQDGVITAGNSSQISDGAAAVLLSSREKAEELGAVPRARIVDQLAVGVDPVTMLTGPIPATRTILKRNGMTIDDLDYVEVNEAFAPVVMAWAHELHADMDRVNPRGGAIALGHPLGSSGARLITTLIHELEDDDKQFGLVTMCCAGGLGTATLVERI
jgi:acetyl-CoA acetyltransferase family protein